MIATTIRIVNGWFTATDGTWLTLAGELDLRFKQKALEAGPPHWGDYGDELRDLIYAGSDFDVIGWSPTGQVAFRPGVLTAVFKGDDGELVKLRTCQLVQLPVHRYPERVHLTNSHEKILDVVRRSGAKPEWLDAYLAVTHERFFDVSPVDDADEPLYLARA